MVGVVGDSTMKPVSQTNLRLCVGAPKLVNRLPRLRRTIQFRIPSPCDFRHRSVVRERELKYGDFDCVIVMAQTPHTEAEAPSRVGTHQAEADGVKRPVDAVLSEADAGHGKLRI